jgi:hypothetical protein
MAIFSLNFSAKIFEKTITSVPAYVDQAALEFRATPRPIFCKEHFFKEHFLKNI